MRYISEMEEAINENSMAVSLGAYDLSRQPRICGIIHLPQKKQEPSMNSGWIKSPFSSQLSQKSALLFLFGKYRFTFPLVLQLLLYNVLFSLWRLCFVTGPLWIMFAAWRLLAKCLAKEKKWVSRRKVKWRHKNDRMFMAVQCFYYLEKII